MPPLMLREQIVVQLLVSVVAVVWSKFSHHRVAISVVAVVGVVVACALASSL